MPKQIKANGLKDGELKIADEALLDIVRYYTREAGVRNLEREIAKICRKAVKSLLLEKKKGSQRSPSTPRTSTSTWACAASATARPSEADRVGQVTGLAWTEVGGELLSIEVAVLPGKGRPLFTGKLGDVMKESIQAAMTVVRSRSDVLGLDKDFYSEARLPRAPARRRDAEGWSLAPASACARPWCRR